MHQLDITTSMKNLKQKTHYHNIQEYLFNHEDSRVVKFNKKKNWKNFR